MPIKFTFQKSDNDPHTYYFISREKSILETNWTPLFSTWKSDTWPTKDYLIPTEHRSNIAVYLGFAWSLLQELDCFVIPNYYRDDAVKDTGLTYESVDWEYKIDPDWNDSISIDEHEVINNSWFNTQPYTSKQPIVAGWQSTPNRAGFFHVSSFMEFANLHCSTTNDAFSEISMFCLKPNRSHELAAFLRSSTTPDLIKFLAKDELFVHILLGIDMGYYDCILVKSGLDISNKVFSLAKQYELAVSEYENDSMQFKTLEQAILRLDKLAKGK